jgi:polar amino acid transport system substrate-binding protein
VNYKNVGPLIVGLLIIGTFSSLQAKAKTELVLCVDNWEGLTNVDGTGSYSEVVKKVYEPDYKVTIKLFPWARAQTEFRNKKCDGLIAENKIDSNYVKPEIRLDALELQAYFLKGKLKFKGEKSLRTLQLAWLRGYNYNKIINYPVRFTEFNSVHSGFKMLEARRFEIMLDYIYTFKDECKTSGADCAKIDSAPSGIIEKAYVVFHNTKKGKKLTSIWDEKMTILIKAGIVQKIFEKYGQKYQ